mmetsp:Transcript_9372/g.21742  ORF Transcript_9372/g.21742 Transcript_9372/m.21742 type:complete len:207 (-) Transcript_9372:525-1145(-)
MASKGKRRPCWGVSQPAPRWRACGHNWRARRPPATAVTLFWGGWTTSCLSAAFRATARLPTGRTGAGLRSSRRSSSAYSRFRCKGRRRARGRRVVLSSGNGLPLLQPRLSGALRKLSSAIWASMPSRSETHSWRRSTMCCRPEVCSLTQLAAPKATPRLWALRGTQWEEGIPSASNRQQRQKQQPKERTYAQHHTTMHEPPGVHTF